MSLVLSVLCFQNAYKRFIYFEKVCENKNPFKETLKGKEGRYYFNTSLNDFLLSTVLLLHALKQQTNFIT